MTVVRHCSVPDDCYNINFMYIYDAFLMLRAMIQGGEE